MNNFVNNVWVGMADNLTHPFNAEARLFMTKTNHASFYFMRECYLNDNGYLQYRRTESFIGYALFWGKNISHEKCMVLLKRAGEELRASMVRFEDRFGKLKKKYSIR